MCVPLGQPRSPRSPSRLYKPAHEVRALHFGHPVLFHGPALLDEALRYCDVGNLANGCGAGQARARTCAEAPQEAEAHSGGQRVPQGILLPQEEGEGQGLTSCFATRRCLVRWRVRRLCLAPRWLLTPPYDAYTPLPEVGWLVGGARHHVLGIRVG